jgi:putative ABC transport system permease protein
MFDDLIHASRLALGHWRRSLLSVLVLALGLTVSATLFSVLDGVLLKPLPVSRPSELFVVGAASPTRPGEPGSVSREDVEVLAALPFVEGVAGYAMPSGHFEPAYAEEERVRDVATLPAFFETLGVVPHVGRLLASEDGLTADPRSIVIGHSLWRARYGGDSSVLGRPVLLGGRDVIVVGVLPPGFAFPDGANVWTAADPPRTLMARRSRGIRAIVRLSGEGRPALEAVGLPPAPDTVIVKPLAEVFSPAESRSVVVLFLATGLAVFLAWIHLGTQQMSLCVERAREIAIRSALGASPGRLVRHWVAESIVFSVFAIVAACAAAPGFLSLLLRLLPGELTLGKPISFDYRTMAYLAALSAAGLVALSAGPALVVRRRELTRLLCGGVGRVRHLPGVPLRSALVALQVALVSALLYVGALALHGWLRLDRVELGFNPERLLSVEIRSPSQQEDTRALFETVQERLLSLPAVSSVAAGPIPLGAGRIGISVLRDPPSRTEKPASRNAFAMPASTDYFRTVGAEVVSGSHPDSIGDPNVVFLSESLARTLGATDILMGQQVFVSGERAKVVGIVRDILGDGPDSPARPYVYLPMELYRRAAFRIYGQGVVRTETAAATVASAIASVVQEVTGSKEPARVVLAEQVYSSATAPARSRAMLLMVLATASLCLALFSLYAATGEAIRLRLRETAVRLALGASRKHVVATLATMPLVAVAVGVASGIGAGVAIGLWASSAWYGLRPVDRIR